MPASPKAFFPETRKAFEDVDLRDVGNKWRKFVNSSGPFLSDI